MEISFTIETLLYAAGIWTILKMLLFELDMTHDLIKSKFGKDK